MVEHSSTANVVTWRRELCELGASDRTAMVASPGFDASITDVWPALTTGACICVPDQETRLTPTRLQAWFLDRGVTVTEVATPLAELLIDLGYRVLEASNPKEAMRVVSAFRAPIHLLLSDVIMPESEGPPLFDRLSALHPESRVLYMSGYADDAVVRHGVLVEGTPFLQKPFTSLDLGRKVREVLHARRPRSASGGA